MVALAPSCPASNNSTRAPALLLTPVSATAGLAAAVADRQRLLTTTVGEIGGTVMSQSGWTG